MLERNHPPKISNVYVTYNTLKVDETGLPTCTYISSHVIVNKATFVSLYMCIYGQRKRNGGLIMSEIAILSPVFAVFLTLDCCNK